MELLLFQHDLLAELIADRTRRFDQQAASERLRPRRTRLRRTAATSLRRLADRLDRPPTPVAARPR
jgi:hypothetical protein